MFDAKYAVEKRGLPVDRDGYAKLELEVVENLEAMEDRIEALAAEAGVEDFNPRSTPQVIAALKARGADLSYMSQKDGKLSADKENLEAVDDELAAAILEFRPSSRCCPLTCGRTSIVTTRRSFAPGRRRSLRRTAVFTPPTGRSERALAG